ncbi:MAG: hypothetical protein AAGI17_09190, partial [Planctomycetota bacterium]
PTYPSPWSFILASSKPLAVPPPTATDALLKQYTDPAYKQGDHEPLPLRMYDGEALVGLAHLPKHLREAIDAETVVYTKDNPPKFFGQGKLGE